MIPLYGFLRGDTIGLLILARAEDQVVELARRLQQAARLRVEITGPVVVVVRGKTVDSRITVAQAGLTALDRFDVQPAAVVAAAASSDARARGPGR
jgi:hypothetical protein